MTELQSQFVGLAIFLMFAVSIADLLCTVFWPAYLQFGIPLIVLQAPVSSLIEPNSLPGFIVRAISPEKVAFREPILGTSGTKGTVAYSSSTGMITLRAIIPTPLFFGCLFFFAVSYGMPARVQIFVWSAVAVFIAVVLVRQIYRCRILLRLLTDSW